MGGAVMILPFQNAMLSHVHCTHAIVAMQWMVSRN